MRNEVPFVMTRPLLAGLLCLASFALACNLTGRTAAGDSVSSDVVDVAFEHRVIENEPASDRPYYGDVKSAGDINGDGFPDIVFGGNDLAWYAYPTWAKSVIAVSNDQFTTDMQLGDINADGRLDVIVPDGRRGVVCWFENPGPGDALRRLWTRHIIGEHGDWTHDVELGDFNNDGKLDVLTRRGATILWLQQTPDSFQAVPIPTALPGGEGTAVADINRDGYLDIIQNGYWLESPSWRKHTIDPEWPRQLTVAVTDLNGDSIPDILFAPAESSGQLCWYRGPKDGSGRWQRYVIDVNIEYVHSLVTGDFNNDGVADVATAEMHQAAQRRVTAYLKDGAAWRKQILSTKGSHNLRAADIGSDGDLDLVGANWGGDYHPLELWENKLVDRPASGWTYVPVDRTRAKWGDFGQPGFLRYFGLADGDFNGDRFDEIVSGRYLYRNPGKDMTKPWIRQDLGVNVDVVAVTDVDGNGAPDILAQALPSLYWLKPSNAEATSWAAAFIGTVPPTEHGNSQGFTLAQIVAGGKPELLVAGKDGIYAFEIPDKPAAGLWPRLRIAAGTSEEGIGIGDVDGDGDIDILASDSGGRHLFWWENPGARQPGWNRHPIGQTTEWADRIVTGDFNQDGRLDVAVSEETPYRNASVYWFAQPARKDGPWDRHTITTQYTTNSLDVADTNGDGVPDLITGEHRGTRKLAIWENLDRGARWKESIVDAGRENHLGARVFDLDHDGRPEIAGIAWDTYANLHLWLSPPTARSATR